MEKWREDLHYNYLSHHGIKGQKWGERNGPPYPLRPQDHSKAELKSMDNNKSKESNYTVQKFYKKIKPKIKEIENFKALSAIRNKKINELDVYELETLRGALYMSKKYRFEKKIADIINDKIVETMSMTDMIKKVISDHKGEDIVAPICSGFVMEQVYNKIGDIYSGDIKDKKFKKLIHDYYEDRYQSRYGNREYPENYKPHNVTEHDISKYVLEKIGFNKNDITDEIIKDAYILWDWD